MTINIYKKYNLPPTVQVQVSKTSDNTYVATFPELLGCLTEAENVVDLLYQVNDALFTYFNISRKDLDNIDFLYSPPSNFLNNIQKLKSISPAQKSVEFHIPYPHNYNQV